MTQIGNGSMIRRIVAGVILLALGMALLGSQVPQRPFLGLGLLFAWGGARLAVLPGRAWGRHLGLIVSGAGLVVALWERTQAGPDGNRALVDLFFLADGPSFSWMEVGVASATFASLSAIAGVLLILPFSRRPHEASGPPA